MTKIYYEKNTFTHEDSPALFLYFQWQTHMWNNWIKEDSVTYSVSSVCIAPTFQRSYTNQCLHIPIYACIYQSMLAYTNLCLHIPIYACIYQPMLALFDFKSLLTISIVIELLFVHIFCLITGKILLNKNKCNTHYVLNSHNNLVKSTATDEQVPGKIKWLAKWVQYYQSWNLILPLLSIDLLCASFYYNCPLNNHVGLG